MNKNRPLILLFILLGGVLFFSMPKWVYSGDPIAIRASSVSLINNGHLGVPFRDQNAIEKFFMEEGSYFIKNQQKLRYYPKWGPAGPLLYTIPFTFEKILGGELNYLQASERSVLLLNLFNMLIALALALYLYLLLGFVTYAFWPRAFTILSTFFATFLWHYLRAQSLEILQCLFFAAYLFHFFSYAQNKQKSKHLLLVSFYTSALFLLKNYFLLLVPVGMLCLLFLLQTDKTLRPKTQLQIGQYFILPVFMGAALLALSNHIRFGAWDATGYETNAQIYANFTGHILSGLWGYFASPRYSIFTHFPVLVFALMGIKIVYQKSRTITLFLGLHFMTFLCLFSSLENWAGEWAYGPRLMLFCLIPLSIFFCAFLESLSTLKNVLLRNTVLVGLICVMLFSCLLQEKVNRFPFFISYLIEQRVSHYAKNTNLEAYFQNTPVPIMAFELDAFKTQQELFYPFIEMDGQESPQEMQRLSEAIEPLLKTNYYWAD